MYNVRKALIALLGSTLLSTAAFASQYAQKANEFKVLPIFTDEDWKANVEVSAVGGNADFDNIQDGGLYGIELSFDCPVFTLPGEHILRQQLSIMKYDKNGFKVTSIEMNPYYSIALSENLLLGFGPGMGAVNGDSAGGDDWAFAFQLGTGLKYYVTEDILVGADLRWQWTDQKSFGTATEFDLENLRTLFKVGYRF